MFKVYDFNDYDGHVFTVAYDCKGYTYNHVKVEIIISEDDDADAPAIGIVTLDKRERMSCELSGYTTKEILKSLYDEVMAEDCIYNFSTFGQAIAMLRVLMTEYIG